MCNVFKILLTISVCAGAYCAQESTISLPRFQDYPATSRLKGEIAKPILATPEQRRYEKEIQEGVSRGAGVWNGRWPASTSTPGPNFAGHYIVIRWGCGSQCVMMAIVDAGSGAVYAPPLSTPGSLYVPLDNLSNMEVDFRLDSSLLVLRDACKDFKNRSTCGAYYFNWKRNRFALLNFQISR